jgi:hypothetical protein
VVDCGVLGMSVKNKQFLHWLADRLVHVYGEPENIDFVLKLRAIADEAGERDTPVNSSNIVHTILYKDGGFES